MQNMKGYTSEARSGEAEQLPLLYPAPDSAAAREERRGKARAAAKRNNFSAGEVPTQTHRRKMHGYALRLCQW